MPVSVFEVPRVAESVVMSGISGVQLNRLLLAIPIERNRDSAHQVLKEMIEAECARLTGLACSVSAR